MFRKRYKHQIFLSNLNYKWMLLVDFSMSPISNFTKTCPDRAELIYVDRQTDMMLRDALHDYMQTHLKLGQQNNQLFKYTQCKTRFSWNNNYYTMLTLNDKLLYL